MIKIGRMVIVFHAVFLCMVVLSLLGIAFLNKKPDFVSRPTHEVRTVPRRERMEVRAAPHLSVAFSTNTTSDHHEPAAPALPYLDKEGRCHLGVVLYEFQGRLDKHHALRGFPRERVGGVLTSKIKFPNNCSMELVFSSNLDRFKHMDVVIFNMIRGTNAPPGRFLLTTNPNQTFIYFSWERPVIRNFKTPVDFMWTYHRTSDIWVPFGLLDKSKPLANKTKTPQEWVQGKSKMVLWIASNCHKTSWPRLNFAKELNKHVPVDIYGKCGTMECLPYLSKNCTSGLLGKYKFYLAVENGECSDYITEKVWEKPLMYGTVPIVYGPTRRNYEDLLPPNSFIHLSDFKSMAELASYLRVLDSDPAKYAKYMEWRYHFGIRIGRPLFSTWETQLFEDVFTAVNMKKKGQLRRRYLGETGFAKSCRPREKMNSSYGIQRWYPW